MTTKQTTAARVAKRMGDDGSRFTITIRGGQERTLAGECKRAGGRLEQRPGRSSDECRWVFRDNSTIVECGGAWDLGLPDSPVDCWCWDGAGHSEECLERQTERAGDE